MPPRHAYWTIILEGQPTAFRAHTPEELAPTLRQLQSRHPDAVMKWFSRGRLWTSPEEARLAQAVRDDTRRKRGPGWRPGGSHQDPRERFTIPRDEKRRRFAERLRRNRLEGARERPDEERGIPPRQDRPARPPQSRPAWAGGGRNRDRRAGEVTGQHRERQGPGNRDRRGGSERVRGESGQGGSRPFRGGKPGGREGRPESGNPRQDRRGDRPSRPKGDRQGGGHGQFQPGGGRGPGGRRPGPGGPRRGPDGRGTGGGRRGPGGGRGPRGGGGQAR
jgi:hypothetical protein